MTNKEYLDTLQVCGVIKERDFFMISEDELKILYDSKISIKNMFNTLLHRSDIVDDINSILYFFIKLLKRVKDNKSYEDLLSKVSELNYYGWDNYGLSDTALINFILGIENFVKTKDLDLRLLKILNPEDYIDFTLYDERYICDPDVYKLADVKVKNKVTYFDLLDETEDIYQEGVALIVLKDKTMVMYTEYDIKSLRTMKKVLREELNKEFDALIMYRDDDIDKMIIDILNEKH